jgi:hypothetical protein
MHVRALMLAIGLSTVAIPAVAGGLHETHEAVAVPPGKLHARAFRPIDQKHCDVQARAHPAGGKVHAGHAAAYSATDCSDEQASAKDEARKRG